MVHPYVLSFWISQNSCFLRTVNDKLSDKASSNNYAACDKFGFGVNMFIYTIYKYGSVNLHRGSRKYINNG